MNKQKKHVQEVFVGVDNTLDSWDASCVVESGASDQNKGEQ